MNIYFAGSICGGRRDAKLYEKIIDYLKNYGKVLTEHVGDQSLTEEGGDSDDDRYIYDRDMKWLSSTDVIIAEVSTPSLGVGYEIARAIQLSKKILCLYRPQKGKRLSAMIAGSPNIMNVEYVTLDDAKNAINTFLKNER
jgi:nucleoside 2-deoxyribosyltransferase